MRFDAYGINNEGIFTRHMWCIKNPSYFIDSITFSLYLLIFFNTKISIMEADISCKTSVHGIRNVCKNQLKIYFLEEGGGLLISCSKKVGVEFVEPLPLDGRSRVSGQVKGMDGMNPSSSSGSQSSFMRPLASSLVSFSPRFVRSLKSSFPSMVLSSFLS